MKNKKFERQKKEHESKIAEKQRLQHQSLQEVVLNHSKQFAGEFWWKCSNHDGSFTYSKEINARWGHPENVVYCAVCCKYFRFKVKDGDAS